jgi:two-component system NtrC family response regulator
MAAAELFGYRKGAFTGAESAHPGHIRAAEGGSLLLDELPELAPDVQAMLLRALENREVLPLGESRAVRIDVRFMSAAQLPLDAAVGTGLLRADLRARLEGGVISLGHLERAARLEYEAMGKIAA